ncbi:MAG: nuclear transport factor 2 family protein [Hydrogenophaga sp.]|nr:nuclear transport factor 2 family protein [Hydrogenophaga sp.]
MHAIEKKLRDGYAAMARGDGAALAQLLASDATWHIPGHSLLAGQYQGAEQIFRFWKKVAALSGGGMRLEVVDVLANDERGVVFVIGRARREGRELEERGLHVYRFSNGLAIEGRFYYEDQTAYDAFWS